MSQELPPKSNLSDSTAKKKSFLSNLSTSAGAATKMVALQAERTKLTSMTLPAAYRALGKDCLQQKRHLDCVAEVTAQLRSVLAEIKQLSEAATGHATPQSFTDKAKAAGKQALDVARTKQLGMKRDSLIASIGKAIYEKHSDSSSSIELVGPIASSIARIAQIDTEMGQHSQAVKGSMVKPKLEWLIPSKRKIAIGFGVGFVLLVLLGVIRHNIAQNVKLQIAEANQFWEQGDQDEAIARYKIVIDERLSFIPSYARPVFFQRVIEHEAEKSNSNYARKLIEKALEENVSLDLTLPQAKEILVAVQTERQRIREEAEAKKRQAALEESVTMQTPNDSTKDDIEELPSREELVALVYKGAATIALSKPLGMGPSPEEFIELTHSVARELQVDKYEHSRFLLNLQPDKDVTKENEGKRSRGLFYGSEMAMFVNKVDSDRFVFISCSIDGEQKINLGGN